MTDATSSLPRRAAKKPSRLAMLTTRFAENRLAVFGLFLVVLAILAALFAPWIAPQNPFDLATLDIFDSMLPPGSTGSENGLHYLLGTDAQGRDVFSSILYGLRTSLIVAFSSVGFSMGIGLVAGLSAAYFGGALDAILMRIVDIQLSFPAILVALVLLAILGQGVDKVILALIIAQWPYFARTARSAALVERNREYILAVRCLNLSAPRIIARHLLPNCLPPLIVIALIDLASSIAIEATLSFLGVGVPVTKPSLGMLISNGFEFLMSGSYWISLFPGFALALVIMGINLAGDHLRDILNPRNS
ncbi:ABC transporter permease [Pseudooceanicola sp. CBS1P-1]|uniref:ABC transporter permease subunit n=1 Tax=Pseudooceanicola albus TaxID=2692189 RepID=A0A6L7G4W3_9RHOB|nr:MULTISPECIES: ABC transporter permease [Pseudooceanicola]MBT9385262.1 ABC transporter permease [Pseudooceanicola endophyticus]MXN18879.1 ABC transporter permease subunit [Pseudooceanicola albus]